MNIPRLSTPLIAAIAGGLALVAAIWIVAWLVFGGDGDDPNSMQIRSGGDVQLNVTPVVTVELPDPLPTRTAGFSSLCTKTDQKAWAAPPQMIIDPSKSYTALLRTEKGDVTIKLLPDIAPYTVNNFAFLACSGFFDGLTFHWVMHEPYPPPPATPQALPFVQSGDPFGNALANPNLGGPGYNLPSELSNREFTAGTVGMSGHGQGSPTSGSQFFITLVDAPTLNGDFTAFGEVISGMDVLNQLTPRMPQDHGPPGDKMLEVTVTEGG